jgi:sugar lactone lactonase YvrE
MKRKAVSYLATSSAFGGYSFILLAASVVSATMLFSSCTKSSDNPTEVMVSTFAGNGTAGDTGDGGLALSAELVDPDGLGIDASGNIYVAGFGSARKIDINTNIITTVAGTHIKGYSGDGGLANSAQIFSAAGFAFDKAGNMYFSDYWNHRVRVVNKATGIISTFAGGGTGLLGDGGLATSATLINPCGLAFDGSGNLYIADWASERIRKVDGISGIITTVAGSGNGGYNGDNIAATSANLNAPYDVAIDPSGNIIIADYYNSRIRKVNVSTSLISTVAGTGVNGSTGDGGLATAAAISGPADCAVDSKGNIYISDYYAKVIRKVTLSTGLISNIAGTGTSGFLDGPASKALFAGPAQIKADASGNLYVTDRGNNRIRKITFPK